MNKSLGFLNFPRIPRDDKHEYRSLLQDELRQHDHDIIGQLNSQVQSVGAALKSAGTLTLTNPIHHVSGVQAIKTIEPPEGFTGPVWLVPDGLWTTIVGGNIGLASTAVVGRVLMLVFDGKTWWPSY
jgi:hypothetical protein